MTIEFKFTCSKHGIIPESDVSKKEDVQKAKNALAPGKEPKNLMKKDGDVVRLPLLYHEGYGCPVSIEIARII